MVAKRGKRTHSLPCRCRKISWHDYRVFFLGEGKRRDASFSPLSKWFPHGIPRSRWNKWPRRWRHLISRQRREKRVPRKSRFLYKESHFVIQKQLRGENDLHIPKIRVVTRPISGPSSCFPWDSPPPTVWLPLNGVRSPSSTSWMRFSGKTVAGITFSPSPLFWGDGCTKLLTMKSLKNQKKCC